MEQLPRSSTHDERYSHVSLISLLKSTGGLYCILMGVSVNGGFGYG